jgi:hypothetical protein
MEFQDELHKSVPNKPHTTRCLLLYEVKAAHMDRDIWPIFAKSGRKEGESLLTRLNLK